MVCRGGLAMVTLDSVVKFLYDVDSNHLAICSSLAAICNARFSSTSVCRNSFLLI